MQVLHVDVGLSLNYHCYQMAGDTVPRLSPPVMTTVNLGIGRVAVDLVMPSDIAVCVLMDNNLVRNEYTPLGRAL
jgi:hypothetical protein